MNIRTGKFELGTISSKKILEFKRIRGGAQRLSRWSKEGGWTNLVGIIKWDDTWELGKQIKDVIILVFYGMRRFMSQHLGRWLSYLSWSISQLRISQYSGWCPSWHPDGMTTHHHTGFQNLKMDGQKHVIDYLIFHNYNLY